VKTIAAWSQAQRKELFEETAMRMGVHPAIVEKDFWVCFALSQLFKSQALKHKLVFKGGTALSKVHGLIQRFSEDIDLILDWRIVTGANPMDDRRSNTAQARLNQEISEKAESYIQTTLAEEVRREFLPFLYVTPQKGQLLEVSYPAALTLDYLRPIILLEIGPLAAWQPCTWASVTPYAYEQFPQVFNEPKAPVHVIRPERTFWEKATILHHEANRPSNSPMPLRYSRNYYDLAMMAMSPVKDAALFDEALLQDVVSFKKRFYARGWAQYDQAKRGSIRIVPPRDRWSEVEKDYGAMRSMIFNEAPSFEHIMNTLVSLEAEINRIQEE